MENENLVPLSAKIPADLKAKLYNKANEAGMTFSSFACMVLANGISDDEKVDDLRGKYARLETTMQGVREWVEKVRGSGGWIFDDLVTQGEWDELLRIIDPDEVDQE